MKLVIQRVERAKVSVNGSTVGEISKGLYILIGVGVEDTKETAEVLSQKVSKMRVMADKNDKMNLSVLDTGASILAVSQFTLYADTTGGNRPSFVKAAKPDLAEEIYNHFVAKLISYGINVKTGKFGEYMKIDALFDGPVTILEEK